MQKVELYDDKGPTPVQEIQQRANRDMIDIDPETGEVIEVSSNEEDVKDKPVKAPFMDDIIDDE